MNYHYQASAAEIALKASTLQIDPQSGRVAYGDKSVILRDTQLGILKILAEHPYRRYAREELLDLLSLSFECSDRTIDSRIKRLRLELRKITVEDFIKTSSSNGYFYDPYPASTRLLRSAAKEDNLIEIEEPAILAARLQNAPFKRGAFIFDGTGHLFFGSRAVHLPGQKSKIAELLFRNPDRIFTKAMLEKHCQIDDPGPFVIHGEIKRIRKNIDRLIGTPVAKHLIISHYNVGYSLNRELAGKLLPGVSWQGCVRRAAPRRVSARVSDLAA